MSVNQNVPTCAAVGTNNGCRPNSTYRNNGQYSSVAESTYHGLHLSFVQRPTHWASVRLSYTLSKSMNDVGEAFFSSPIDPTDITRDWGRSDDDQRHRLVINGTVNTSMAPATTVWEHISPRVPDERHVAVVLSAPVQHHVRRRESASDDKPAARRWRDGARQLRRAGRIVHPSKRWNRQRFLHPESSRESRVSDHRRCQDRGPGRSFQRDESREQPDQESHLGTGRLSHEPQCRRSTRSWRSAIRGPFSSAPG